VEPGHLPFSCKESRRQPPALSSEKTDVAGGVYCGRGRTDGGRFEELAAIREFAPQLTESAVGFCLDTLSSARSGHDVSTEAGLKENVAQGGRHPGAGTMCT